MDFPASFRAILSLITTRTIAELRHPHASKAAFRLRRLPEWRADFSLGPKQPPRWGALIPPILTFALLILGPCAEESWRDWRKKDRKKLSQTMRVRFNKHQRAQKIAGAII